MFNIPTLKKKIAQCERTAPVFWVMHELENEQGWVWIDFLDTDNTLLQSEKMRYDTPRTCEETLKKINQIRAALILTIC